MEAKKSPRADLEKKKGVFLQIGLIVVLAIMYMAFEWTTGEKKESSLGQLTQEEVYEEEILNTFRDNQPPPPPPPQAEPEVLEIVEDDVVVENELIIEDSEAKQDQEVKVQDVTQEEEVEEEPLPFFILEDKPEFPGGEEELLKWIAKTTKYPEIAKENGISGRVFVEFVIDKTGKVTKAQIKKGVDPYLDAEALRVVKSMPDWKPGKQRGKTVPVSYQLPIKFTLTN